MDPTDWSVVGLVTCSCVSGANRLQFRMLYLLRGQRTKKMISDTYSWSPWMVKPDGTRVKTSDAYWRKPLAWDTSEWPEPICVQ